MTTEPVESYPYTDFPLTSAVPQPIYTFQQKHKFFPGEIAINPVYLDLQREYVVPGPRLQPLAPLPPNKDFEAVPFPLYDIVVVPDNNVAPSTLVCRGRAVQVGTAQSIE